MDVRQRIQKEMLKITHLEKYYHSRKWVFHSSIRNGFFVFIKTAEITVVKK